MAGWEQVAAELFSLVHLRTCLPQLLSCPTCTTNVRSFIYAASYNVPSTSNIGTTIIAASGCHQIWQCLTRPSLAAAPPKYLCFLNDAGVFQAPGQPLLCHFPISCHLAKTPSILSSRVRPDLIHAAPRALLYVISCLSLFHAAPA